eukprot:TRINITY_DN12448_c0_g1_i1.p1 TRINITY_DN12448_c0_g1~~TRINITY_DN12448_c0_g1_i1.p1  ORF type:complete len:347 (-),score=137.38 TRINITY_DN12448_c0_g1_i1:126-1166(-)
MPKEIQAPKMYDEEEERWDDSDGEDEPEGAAPEEEDYDSDLEAKRELERIKGTTEPSRPSIYEADAMDEKVKELQNYFNSQFKTGKKAPKVPWSERLDLIASKGVEIEPSKISDDIQREVGIYNITLENALEGLKKIKEEGLAIDRPDDYFVEMFKSDKVMQKVKSKLVAQQVRIQNFEEKKHKKDLKKISKQLKARKEFEKHKEKRTNLEAIEKWRQEIREKGDSARDLDDILKENKDKMKKKGKFEGGDRDFKRSSFKKRGDSKGRDGRMEEEGGSWRGNQRGKGDRGERGGRREVLADRSKGIRKDGASFKGKGKAKQPKKQRLGKIKRQRLANKKRSKGGKK